MRPLLRLAANPLAKEGGTAFENHATTGAEGEKLHRFAIRKRDPSEIEADPPTGLERFVEQPFEHHDVLLGDLPREAKNYVGGSFERGFDSQHRPR